MIHFGLLFLLALTATPSAPAVVYRDGSVSAAEFAAWRRHVGRVDPEAAEGLVQDAEELVLARVLAGRFDREGLGRTADALQQERRLELELYAERLRQALSEDVSLSEQELREAFRTDPALQPLPRRYRIENIFKRFPKDAGDDQKGALRRRMEEIRERILAGADFARVALEESESETRLRGGRIGYVTLEHLGSRVAPAVAGLKAGDLSPVVETGEGLVLIRCTGIQEAWNPTFDEQRDQLADRLRQAKLEDSWTALSASLLRAAGAAEGLDQTRREDVLTELRAAEALRRGLITDDVCEELGWRRLVLRARAAALAEAEAALREPAEADLQASYEANREGLRSPRRMRLRALVLPVDPAKPRSLYDTILEVGARTAAGSIGLEEAAAILAPHAEIKDFGWLPYDHIFRLGVLTDSRVGPLKPGQLTAAFQDGPAYFIWQLLDEEAERQLSFEETRDRLRQASLASQRAQLGARLRAQLVTDQAILIVREDP